jgi:peptidoglycan/xylan/chitin deacetylase (PgdA/CDA1 family)
MTGHLPVLMYHGLHASAQAPGRFDVVYSVTPDDFARQLDWLAGNGYRGVRLRDLGATDNTCKPVIISFDDGDVSNLEIALPLLTERGFAAEYFITADFVDQPGMLSTAGVRALADAGMGVQSHGCTHRYLEDLDAAALEAELRESKQRLESLTGGAVEALALPGGRGGERERRMALQLGYRDVLNSEPGRNLGWQRGEYLQRLAITRGLALADFAALVNWRGVTPRWIQARHHLLGWPKRLLGNQRYERWRARVLRS